MLALRHSLSTHQTNSLLCQHNENTVSIHDEVTRKFKKAKFVVKLLVTDNVISVAGAVVT